MILSESIEKMPEIADKTEILFPFYYTNSSIYYRIVHLTIFRASNT
jgi:hypothetical protein